MFQGIFFKEGAGIKRFDIAVSRKNDDLGRQEVADLAYDSAREIEKRLLSGVGKTIIIILKSQARYDYRDCVCNAAAVPTLRVRRETSCSVLRFACQVPGNDVGDFEVDKNRRRAMLSSMRRIDLSGRSL